MASKHFLKNPPDDGITSLVFHPSSGQLLASSWDRTLRLYDRHENAILQKIDQKAAVLAAAFLGAGKCVSGGLDSKVTSTDLETGQSVAVGRHADPVRALGVCERAGVVFSGSWDRTLKVWDPRTGAEPVKTHPLRGKVRAMAFSAQLLVVAVSGGANYIFDMREDSQPFEQRESPLKKPICCVGANPDGKMAYGSTEGRVAIENIDSIHKNQNYAFKCHRSTDKETKTTYLYPVTAIAYHPKHFTFATGGCDGLVNIWDGYNKKRIAQLAKYDESISALAFDAKGEKLAVGVSYMWHEGEKEFLIND